MPAWRGIAVAQTAVRDQLLRILFITSNRIGDAVLSSALLGYLVDRYPGARFTIASGPASAPLFEAVPGLERLIPMLKRRWGGHWLSLWADTVTIAWDMVVDFRASIFAWTVISRERRVYRYNHALGHRLRHPRGVLGSRHRPDREVAAPAGHRVQHHPAPPRGRSVQQDSRQVGRPSPRRGLQAHPPRRLDFVALHLAR